MSDNSVVNGLAIAEAVHAEAGFHASRCAFSDRPDIDTVEKKLIELKNRDPLPTKEQLAPLVEHLFWASLLTDEGRPTRFTVMYEGEADLRASHEIHRLGEEVPISPRNIRKLAPAHDPLRGYLAIRFTPEPHIHGIGVPTRTGSFPFFTVSSQSTGVLQFTWQGTNLARLRNGTIERFSQMPLPSEGLRQWIRDALPGLALIPGVQPVIKRISALGHGGALWIVGKDEKLSDKVQVGWNVTNQFDYFADWEKTDMPFWSAGLGNLASTDGAVVINSEMQLLGFGAFTQLLDDNEQVLKYTAPGLGEMIGVGGLGGGRHRSAAAFCARHTPSVAIVVSEDGTITTMRHIEGHAVEVAETSPLGFAFLGWE